MYSRSRALWPCRSRRRLKTSVLHKHSASSAATATSVSSVAPSAGASLPFKMKHLNLPGTLSIKCGYRLLLKIPILFRVSQRLYHLVCLKRESCAALRTHDTACEVWIEQCHVHLDVSIQMVSDPKVFVMELQQSFIPVPHILRPYVSELHLMCRSLTLSAVLTLLSSVSGNVHASP